MSPTLSSHTNLFTILLTLLCEAWCFFASAFKCNTTSCAFWSFNPSGLTYSLQISHLHNALAQSTAPFPWLETKKFQVIWQPNSKVAHEVRDGYQPTKNHALDDLNWPKQPFDLMFKWETTRLFCVLTKKHKTMLDI
jgi:hypothetical protein